MIVRHAMPSASWGLNGQWGTDTEGPLHAAVARRAMPRGLLAVASLILLTSAGHSDADGIAGSSYSVGFWEGAAYADQQTGGFYNCEASVGYRNGDIIYYSLDAEGTQYIGVRSADLNMGQNGGQNAPTAIATVTVDQRQPRQIVALRASPDFYLLDITADMVVLDQFKAGRNLRIELNGKVLDYDLQDSARAVELTQECAETQRLAMRAEPAPQPAPEVAPAPGIAAAAPAPKKGQTEAALGTLAAPQTDGFFPGEIVEVTLDGTAWIRATVTTVARKGTEVEIDAATNNGTARRVAIAAGNIRKMTATPAPAPAPAPASAPAPATAAAAATTTTTGPAAAPAFAVGDQVEIRSGCTWYSGAIKEVRADGTWRISYDGYDSIYDENIPASRLRPRGSTDDRNAAATTAEAAAPAFVVGDQVEIRYGGTWYPGAIKEARADGTWRVSYDGYDSSWDENVRADRLRARGSADDRTAAAATAPERPETFSWPAHPPGYQAGLGGAYYSHTTSFFNNVLQIYPSMYFLTDNGRFARSPSEGFSFDELGRRDIALEGEGIYWIEGDEVVFIYADETRNSDRCGFSGSHDTKSLLRVFGNGATPAKGFARGTRFDGGCGGGASIGGGTSSATSLTLNADGTYRWGSSVSFAVTGGNVERADGSIVQYESSGGSSGADTGRYEFDGYSLTFISDRGTTTVATIAAFGDDLPNGMTQFLYMNGSTMTCG